MTSPHDSFGELYRCALLEGLELPDPLEAVCQLSACESDTPCRFGRCIRPYPWRRTPSSILESLIPSGEAAMLTGALSFEQYVSTHKECFEAWYFTVDEYVQAFRTASPSDPATCRRFVDRFPEILLCLRRDNANPSAKAADLAVKPRKRKEAASTASAAPRKPQRLTLTTT